MTTDIFFERSDFRNYVVRSLSPERLRPFRLERTSPVLASEVISAPEAIHHLQSRAQKIRDGLVSPSITELNATPPLASTLTDNLLHQDLKGSEIVAQARMLANLSLIQTLQSHPETECLRGHERSREYYHQASKKLHWLLRLRNLASRHKIKTTRGSMDEIDLAQLFFGTVWPAGTNLYATLGSYYPAFHAILCGQIPLKLAISLSQPDESATLPDRVPFLTRKLMDDRRRFFGTYPTIALASSETSLDSQFVSQDQLGRRAIASRVVADLIELVQQDDTSTAIVIDYAGGVGNQTELVLKEILSLPDARLRSLLTRRVRAVVLDASRQQIDAGRERFDRFGSSPGLLGIETLVRFIQHDVALPLEQDFAQIFGDEFLKMSRESPVCLGMTSYMLGALSTRSMANGKTWTDAFADTCRQTCWKVYAVDFSSPAWRETDFLADTGELGQSFLNLYHGRFPPEDEGRALPPPIAKYLSRKFGRPVKTHADRYRALSAGPAVAASYMTVWPGEDGHCAGYSIQPDGTLKKPAIISFAERLSSAGIDVRYRSEVRLNSTFDVGPCDGDRRVLALVPGWIADFVVATRQSPNLRGIPAKT